MLITCPHCGPRPLDEFTFLGDASPWRPQSHDESAGGAWLAYVFLRGNPKGRFDEYAHHAGGCRSWLVITRDTQTHDVFEVVTARAYAARRTGAAP